MWREAAKGRRTSLARSASIFAALSSGVSFAPEAEASVGVLSLVEDSETTVSVVDSMTPPGPVTTASSSATATADSVELLLVASSRSGVLNLTGRHDECCGRQVGEALHHSHITQLASAGYLDFVHHTLT